MRAHVWWYELVVDVCNYYPPRVHLLAHVVAQENIFTVPYMITETPHTGTQTHAHTPRRHTGTRTDKCAHAE